MPIGLTGKDVGGEVYTEDGAYIRLSGKRVSPGPDVIFDGAVFKAANKAARDAIPASVLVSGDMCIVIDTTSLYTWTGSAWKSPAANKPMLRASGGSVAVPSGLGSPTILTPPNVSYDVTNAYNPANGRFTPKVAGIYMTMAVVNYASNGLANCSAAFAYIYKNGTPYISTCIPARPADASYPVIPVMDTIYLNGTTDYLNAATAQNSPGVASGVGCPQFSAFLISEG